VDAGDPNRGTNGNWKNTVEDVEDEQIFVDKG
jgi:hypothetical protein